VALHAVVPVKNLIDSKRRLSAVFTSQERQELTLAMLEDVLTSLKSSVVDAILVVGEDTRVQQVAQNCGASYLMATKDGLNPTIEEATNWCVKFGAHSTLVVPSDVPLLKTQDVNRIAQLSSIDRSIVVSPSINWGTNALLQCPPRLIPSCFGPKSFIAHIREAYVRNVSVRLHFSVELAIDVDSAEDLRRLFEIKNDTNCKRVLEQFMKKSDKTREFFSKKN
jgi:2-phospho-L-lactate guanylyltransferase